MARTGLRTLCLAVREQGLPDGYLEAPPDEDMTLCAIVGIKVGAASVRLLCLCEAAACSFKCSRCSWEPLCVPKRLDSQQAHCSSAGH